MSHENMPGYRPPDTHPSQASTEDGTVTAYAQEQRQELENLLHFAEQQIARITGRINEYDIADRAIPEEILTELNEWVDVAHQITWSLIRDLFEQQGLDITQVQELIDEQAPMLSWCTNINSYFQQKLNESLHTANSQVSSVRTEESLTPQEFVSAQEALAGLTDILKGVFVRQPEFRNKPALLGTILLFSLLLLLIPAFSPRDQNTSLFDHLEVPAAQVAAHYSDQHFSTPIPSLSSNLPTSSSTPQPSSLDNTPSPTPPPAQVFTQPLDTTRVQNQPSDNIEVAIADEHHTSIGVHVQNPDLEQISAEDESEESMQINDVDRAPNITPITDAETTKELTDYISLSPVKIPDFSSPELAQLSDVMKRAISATNVAIVDTDRPDHLFAHGSLVVDSEGNLSLRTVAHVVLLHLYHQQGDQSVLKNSSSMYLVVTDSEGLHYYRIKLSVSDISIDPTGKQDGLAEISLKLGDGLPGSDYNLPTIEPMSYSDYKSRTFGEEGQPGSAVVYTTSHSVTHLIAQAGFLSREFGTLTSWGSIDVDSPPTEPITENGDSGRGVSAEINGKCYLVGVTRGVSQAVNPAGNYSQFINTLMAYPFLNVRDQFESSIK